MCLKEDGGKACCECCREAALAEGRFEILWAFVKTAMENIAAIATDTHRRSVSEGIREHTDIA